MSKPAQFMERDPEHDRNLHIVDGTAEKRQDIPEGETTVDLRKATPTNEIGSAAIAGAQEKERFPDYEFDLSESQMIGNAVISVQPQRRLIRVMNQLADARPDEIPHITTDHHLLNYLKRERNAIAHGVRQLPNVKQLTEELRAKNHPIAQLFDQFDAKYRENEAISPGQIQAMKADVLIIAQYPTLEDIARE